MKLHQILFLLAGMSMLSPVFAEDEGSNYDAALVSYAAQEPDDGYDDGDYAAAPIAWDARKAVKRPATATKQPLKKDVKKVSKATQKSSQQHWASLEAGQDAFE